ncbi:MAG TPA: toxin-antitoxin system YwqK family antitoxin [Cyclobacteriaceae bacterium]
MKQFLRFFAAFLTVVPSIVFSQGIVRKTYHDAERKYLKEVYHVTDTIQNILMGPYESYYLNGKLESRGQFVDNETAGVWEFFYETGGLKMRGILRQNANYGLWEYYYENGQKSMEGMINGRHREGEWKTYYENGQLKEIGQYNANKRVGYWKTFYEDGAKRGEIVYDEDYGRYTEYYHSGKVMGEGPKRGPTKVGHWRYFAESGNLESEGELENGRRIGEWVYYHPNGTVSARGSFRGDKATGAWTYYNENGAVSATGSFEDGVKIGHWKTLSADGAVRSEVTYVNGAGEYREYYTDGRLKVKGRIENDIRQGRWEFYYPDGTLEGECEYENGRGKYKGYYSTGALQTTGEMEQERKVGTWEIYEKDGRLSGYYRPFYDENRILATEITEMVGQSNMTKVVTRGNRFIYFVPRANEFKGVIVGTNPLFLAAGRLPIGLEFYLQERLGHEFEFIGIRDPFFKSDQNITPGTNFIRGYSVAIKQKFYNPMKIGMWYFGHELRFTNLGHFSNVVLPQFPDFYFTVSGVEQRIEYGPLVGYRLLQRGNSSGLSIDAFVSYNIGYRGFDVDPNYSPYFNDVERSPFSNTFHFGLNFGKSFSFR